MTTIVYSHERKEIAMDSRASRGGMVVTDKFVKMFESKGVKFFMAGLPADVKVLMEMYEDPEIMGLPEVECLVLDGGKVYSVCPSEEGTLSILECTFDCSIGSGGEWALAALDFGRTTRQAVKYATTRDLYSGGKISVIKVK